MITDTEKKKDPVLHVRAMLAALSSSLSRLVTKEEEEKQQTTTKAQMHVLGIIH